jgi:ribonuclease R
MAKPRSPKSSKFPAASKGAKAPKPPAGLPDRETLIAFLRDAGEAGKADIARHFGLKGADRRALREMLRALETEGAWASAAARASPKPAPCPRSAWSTWSSATPTATSMSA